MIQCDREIKARKPYTFLVNKNERSCAIIDTVIPRDIGVSEKGKKKMEIPGTKDRNQKNVEH